MFHETCQVIVTHLVDSNVFLRSVLLSLERFACEDAGLLPPFPADPRPAAARAAAAATGGLSASSREEDGAREGAGGGVSAAEPAAVTSGGSDDDEQGNDDDSEGGPNFSEPFVPPPQAPPGAPFRGFFFRPRPTAAAASAASPSASPGGEPEGSQAGAAAAGAAAGRRQQPLPQPLQPLPQPPALRLGAFVEGNGLRLLHALMSSVTVDGLNQENVCLSLFNSVSVHML